MSASDEGKGIRGDELADDAAATNPVPPNSDPFGADGIRGDGLADDATPVPGETATDPDETTEDGIRGDGLAEDA